MGKRGELLPGSGRQDLKTEGGLALSKFIGNSGYQDRPLPIFMDNYPNI
jgi:hypothetical protein